MIVCHMSERGQNIILITIDIGLDNWLTFLSFVTVNEIINLRKIMVVGDMA